MFVPAWLVFLASGTIMAIAALVWSLRTSQFEDQDRARYLPMVGLSPGELASRPPVRRSAFYFVLVSILLFDAAAIGATLVLAVRYM